MRRLLAVICMLVLAGCDYTVLSRYPDGSPYTWRCHPVVWQINPAGFTATEINDFRDAFRAAHAATGIRVDFDGFTDRRPTAAPNGVVIVYRADLPGTTAASTWNHWNGGRYSGGTIQVDYNLPAYFFDDMAWHEVGHVFGLGHAPSEGQVMSTDGADPPYRDGDLAGLTAVGGC